jgi:hypothetical protein
MLIYPTPLIYVLRTTDVRFAKFDNFHGGEIFACPYANSSAVKS